MTGPARPVNAPSLRPAGGNNPPICPIPRHMTIFYDS
jgi:hypothetical protein